MKRLPPLSPHRLAQARNLTDLAWDDDGALVWRETRGGEGILVVQPADGQARRDLNDEFAASGGVGYGGGDFSVGRGAVFFVERASKRIYRQELAGSPARPITPTFGAAAAPVVSPDGAHLLFVHTLEGQDCLAVVDTQGKNWPRQLVQGDDFYMQPCWSPDGRHVAWIAWNHPQMPWDGTTLKMGDWINGELRNIRHIAGGENVSIFQPQFTPNGRFLAYVSDESGWWQIYLHDLQSSEKRQLTHAEAEHGAPAWIQGLRTYGFGPNSRWLYFLRNQNAFVSLWRVDVEDGKEERLPLPEEYTWLEQIAVHPQRDVVALLASGGRTPKRLLTFDVHRGETRVIARSQAEDLPPEAYAAPQAISWPTHNGEQVHGLFYAPAENALGAAAPPLVVMVHGGPTSQRGAAFYPEVQFFTTRGYAVLQVNYRGSTGYGRAYREALKGNWGIYDVEDSVSGARHLADAGRVDGSKMVIMGGSAGGFTVLKALEDYPRVFKAGVCSYGVANQFTLVMDTHKFEAHYSDSLLGPLPQAAAVYHQRSPVFFADKIRDPLLVFQGEEDKVVPRAQSDAIVEALRRNGVPHEYHLYAGEGHGFRKPETIEHFYATVERFLKVHVLYAA